MTERTALNPTWDLESLFPGGSSSPEFLQFLDALQNDIPEQADAAAKLSPATTSSEWKAFWSHAQNLSARMIQASAFVGCLTAQNMKDKAAKLLEGRVKKLQAELRAALVVVDGVLLQISDSDWQALLQQEGLRPISFTLNERRETAKKKLSTDAEVVFTSVGVPACCRKTRLAR